MRFRSARFLCFTLIRVLSTSVASGDPPPQGSTVIATVGKLRAPKGNIACRLFFQEKSFPRGTESTIRKSVRVSGDFARCVFENVPPGTYAMTVIHDENDNGKLDKNFIGMPTEGYGVSNNKTHATSAPVWSECKFVVEAGKKRELSIGLRY
jgi:uncharacterized protein (DUF2141 family)